MMKTIHLCRYTFSALCTTVAILPITAILFLTLPCTNAGWAMTTDEQEETEGKKTHPLILKTQKAEAPVEETNLSSTNKYPISSHSGPQWGLGEKEIEYLFKNSKDLVCIIEFGGHFKRLSQSWKYLLGWELQELLDTPHINFVHPDDVQKTLEYEKEFMPAGLVNRYRCKDGSYRWLDWIGLSKTSEEHIKDEQGYPLTIARDITLHKILEAQFEDKIKKTSERTWYETQRLLEAITEIQYAHISEIFDKNEKSNTNNTLKQRRIMGPRQQ